MDEKRLFLLDAYALIFRAYYALIKMPRITQSGFNTSAIFGFVNTLEEILRKQKPSHIAVCFDPAGPTFRNEAFKEYKGEREATPENIKLSVPIIKEIVKAYNIPVIEVEGFEADDVIGTLAKMAEKEGYTTYMMTPDKDFGQLVSPNILQYKPAYRGQDFELRGEKEVCDRYGIKRTEQVIDLLALMGDKIDNIPGCPGIGEKTAAKLIQDFDSVENLLENTDRLKGAQKIKVEENKEQILFSKYLATIRTDVPMEITPDKLKRESPDKEKLFEIFSSLEFKTLIDRVGKRLNAEEKSIANISNISSSVPLYADGTLSLFDEPEDFSSANNENLYTEFNTSDRNYSIIDSKDKLHSFSTKYQTAKQCGIYLVTEGENDMAAEWIGTAISFINKEAVYIPTSFEEGKNWMLDIFANKDICKTGSDIKRDMVITSGFRTYKSIVFNNFYDITLAHYVLQPEMRHSIPELASTYLKIANVPESIIPNKKNINYKTISADIIFNLACTFADLTLQLKSPLDKEIEKHNMKNLLYDIEIPLVRVLADMEVTGVRLDVDALNKAAIEMEGRINSLEKEICELAGETFNVGSPSKVGEILFDKLGLDSKAKKTKTGQYSTSEDILEKLTSKHPIVSLILQYRALKKLYSTYLTALPAAINPNTDKIHTNYNQTVTSTGRISSTSPNLQNIPVRDDEGREIRRAFIADPGHLFLSADYSQIELRLVADFAKDETMIEAFHNNEDIHTITAAKIYHKENEDVTPNERRNAKTANFGILYGISAFGLASRLGIPRSEAKEIIDNYFTTFPTIHKYMNDSIEFAREKGYVETKAGRKRYLADINSKNPVVRGYAERNAINAPVQGSAADIIKRAMVDIYKEMENKNLKSKMIMQVHDELNFDVLPEELPVMQELVERLMQNAYHGKVKLTASCGVAHNWLEAH